MKRECYNIILAGEYMGGNVSSGQSDTAAIHTLTVVVIVTLKKWCVTLVMG